MARDYHYGTAAAPLAARHPGSVSPLVVYPLPAATVLAALAGRPRAALLAFGISVGVMTSRLHSRHIPAHRALRISASSAFRTWLATGRYATEIALPGLAFLLAQPGTNNGRTRFVRRLAVASLVVGPPATDYLRRNPHLDPVRFTAIAIAQDVSYGAGVWRGAIAARDPAALLPSIKLSPRIRRLWRRPAG
jgi:hypothetical protein